MIKLNFLFVFVLVLLSSCTKVPQCSTDSECESLGMGEGVLFFPSNNQLETIDYINERNFAPKDSDLRDEIQSNKYSCSEGYKESCRKYLDGLQKWCSESRSLSLEAFKFQKEVTSPSIGGDCDQLKKITTNVQAIIEFAEKVESEVKNHEKIEADAELETNGPTRF